MAIPRRELLRHCGALALAAGLGTPAAQAQAAPLRLGLPPFLSPTAVVALFRPLREHLERQLGRPVLALTARDFRSLAASTRAQEFDLVLLPAQLARLATLDWGWLALAGTLARTPVQLLVQADSPLRTLADIREGERPTRLGALDALSMVSAAALATLRARGLADERQLQLVVQPSVNSALFALARGEVDVVALAQTQLATVPPSTPRNDRVLAELADIKGPIYVASPRVPEPEQRRLRDALLAFEPDPAAALSAANARLFVLSPADLASLDGAAAEARRILAAR